MSVYEEAKKAFYANRERKQMHSEYDLLSENDDELYDDDDADCCFD